MADAARAGGWKDPRQSELKDGLRRLAKQRVVNLNKEIAEHAKSKQLAKASASFARARALGVLNNYSYTNMINAHVRCGDVPGAARLLEEMKTSPHPPCVVAYTTLIKGLCGVGQIGAAARRLAEMRKQRPPVAPTIRTVNTFLRGCLLAGAVEPAHRVYLRLPAWKVAPDGSTYEYIVCLLGQALRLGQAVQVLTTAQTAADAEVHPPNALPRASAW